MNIIRRAWLRLLAWGAHPLGGFSFCTIYEPNGDVLALHFARDEVSFERSIEEWHGGGNTTVAGIEVK